MGEKRAPPDTKHSDIWLGAGSNCAGPARSGGGPARVFHQASTLNSLGASAHLILLRSPSVVGNMIRIYPQTPGRPAPRRRSASAGAPAPTTTHANRVSRVTIYETAGAAARSISRRRTTTRPERLASSSRSILVCPVRPNRAPASVELQLPAEPPPKITTQQPEVAERSSPVCRPLSCIPNFSSLRRPAPQL